jgi:F0F1-type ATP synthase membrane subunit c/vacuolar-type H+-ATPase subunit K
MLGLGYALSQLGSAYFSAVSRNPTIGNIVGTNLLILITMIELGMVVLIAFGFLLIFKL